MNEYSSPPCMTENHFHEYPASPNLSDEEALKRKLAIIMVGMPACGKTITSRGIHRYLRWCNISTALVNVAQLRSRTIGEGLKAEFFDPSNDACLLARTKIADQALELMIAEFVERPTKVVILDASNTTRQRRAVIHKRLREVGIGTVVFIECSYAHSDQQLHLWMSCPEYRSQSPEAALTDYKKRIQYYSKTYETLDPTEQISYIKLCNGGSRLMLNQLRGYLPTQILYFLINMSLSEKRIFLCPKQANLLKAIALVLKSYKENSGLVVWTGIQMILDQSVISEHFSDISIILKESAMLNDLDMGIFEGWSEDQIQQSHPKLYADHNASPYRHRYPRGESYHDLAIRLEPLILQLERSPDSPASEKLNAVLIVADLPVLRCIYAYYTEIEGDHVPNVLLSQDHLIQLIPKAYGYEESRISVPTSETVRDSSFTYYREFL